MMSNRNLSIQTGLLFLIFIFWSHIPVVGSSLQLYTPYTKISVPPGETINYSIDVINNDSITKGATVYVTGLSKNWGHSLRSDGWNISEIAVLPGEKKTLSLQVEVPYEVKKGNYTFKLIARGHAELPLKVTVSQQGTLKTEFTTDQANMQGHAGSGFTFRTKLKNLTGEKQLFALSSTTPRGWSVVFKPNYQQATSVEIEPNQTKDISIEINPPHTIKAGKYSIPVLASTKSTAAELNLEVDISGNYKIELTTPSGLLSKSITAGKEKKIDLEIRNSGSTDLKNIRLSANKPRGWEVSFTSDTIPFIEAGKSATSHATVKAYDKAIPGDYVIGFTAQTPEATSSISYRMSVKTSLLWGWLGLSLIAGCIAGIIILFKKYGRR